MVYKKYIKRGGKIHGPYYYKSVREKNGLVKKIYLGTTPPKQENKVTPHTKRILRQFLPTLFFIAFTLLFIAFMFLTTPTTNGKTVLEINKNVSSEAYMEIDSIFHQIPLNVTKINEDYYYIIQNLSIHLDPGTHNIKIIDNNQTVYNENITIQEKTTETNITPQNQSSESNLDLGGSGMDLSASQVTCGQITTSTTLDQNINTNGTCFLVNSNNIIIDGAGYTVTGDNGTGDFAVNITNFNNITVKNMIIRDFQYAIRSSGSSNITIENNSITNHALTTKGFYVTHGQDYNITQNQLYMTAEGCWGIYSINLTNPNIQYNLVECEEQDVGNTLYLTNNNNCGTISNNNITILPSSTTGGQVLHLSKCNNSISQNNIINYSSSISGFGVNIDRSFFNLINNTTIYSTDRGIVFLTSSSENNISESTVDASSDFDIEISNAGENNNLINLTFSKNDITFSTAGSINILWYIDVNVTSSGSPLNNANIFVYNRTNALEQGGTTDSQGLKRLTLKEFKYDGAYNYSTPHNITINKTGYTENTTTLNLTQTEATKHQVELSSLPGVTCGDNITSSTTLTASDPITQTSCNGTALFIGNNNLVLDCAGFTVQGNGTTADVIPIISSSNNDNVTIKNCIIQNGGRGIQISYSENITIQNNTIKNLKLTSGSENLNAIRFIGTNNSIAKDNNITNLSIEGASLSVQAIFIGQELNLNITIENNDFSDIDHVSGESANIIVDAVDIEDKNGQANNTIKYNRANNIRCSSNNCSAAGFFVITESSGSDNVVLNNNISNSEDGIALLNTGQNNASGNILENITTECFILGLASLGTSSNKTIENNQLTNCGTGIRIEATTNANFSGNTYTNNTLNIDISANSTNINFLSPLSEISISSYTSNVSFTNLTLGNLSTANVNFLNLIITDKIINTTKDLSFGTNSLFINGTSSTGLNITSNITFTDVSYSTLSAFNILKDGVNCTECIKLNNNPVKFQVQGYTNYTAQSLGISCGNNITSSTTLTASDPITQTSCNGTALFIGNNNLVLDCAGYTMNYSTNGTLGYGINNTGYDNVTIKNCIIHENNGTTNEKYAIYFNSGNNGTIENNTISTNGSHGYGIFIDVSSDSNNLTGNTINSEGNFGYGIYLSSSSDSNTLTNNIITTIGNGGYGIYLASSSNSNVLTSNTINTTGSNGYGIYLASSSNSNITNNNIDTNGSDGYGINLENSNSNVLTSNTISTNGSHGYGVSVDVSSDSNNLTDNTINSEGNFGYGIYLSSSSDSNILTNNIITTIGNRGHGIYLTSSSNSNVLTSNTINTTGSNGVGIYLTTSSNSNITNNNINTSGSNGYGINLESNSGNNSLLNNNISTNQTYGIYDTTGINYSNDLIYNNSYGQTYWNKTNLTTNISLSIGSTIFLENNLVGLIDDTNAQNLNSSAQIKIRNLTYSSTPFLLKNNVRCDNNPSLCNITEYNNITRILTADIASFSNYTTIQGDTQRPSITEFTVDPSPATAGKRSTITCTATDDIAVTSITITVGTFTVCSGTSSCSGTYAAGSDYTVRCTAQDAVGNTATQNLAVTVVAEEVKGPGPSAPPPAPPPPEVPEERPPVTQLPSEVQAQAKVSTSVSKKGRATVIELEEEKTELEFYYEEIDGIQKPRLDLSFDIEEIVKKYLRIKQTYFSNLLYLILALIVSIILLGGSIIKDIGVIPVEKIRYLPRKPPEIPIKPEIPVKLPKIPKEVPELKIPKTELAKALHKKITKLNEIIISNPEKAKEQYNALKRLFEAYSKEMKKSEQINLHRTLKQIYSKIHPK